MNLHPFIKKLEELRRETKSSNFTSTPNILRTYADFTEYDLDGIIQAMIDGQSQYEELEKQLDHEYPDQQQILNHEHNEQVRLGAAS